MTLSVADLDRWDPQALRDAGAAAGARGRAALEAVRALTLLPALGGWDGLAASAGLLSLQALLVDLRAHAGEAETVARAARHAADAVAALKAELRDLEDAAHAARLDIDHERGAVLPAAGFPGGPAELAAASAPLADRLAGILARATEVDTELARAISLAGGTAAPRAPAGSQPLPPDAVARWWGSLPEPTRRALIAADPQRYGNYGGVPAADRDTANRAALAADLAAVDDTAQAHRVGVDDVLADPQRYGLTDAQASRYANAAQVRQALADAVLRTGAPVLLWAYRPEAFDGRGRAALAIGDPDRAADTAVLVPGTGSSVAGGWLADSDAANLFNELALAEPTAAHSVIAWMGYQAPTSLADPRVAQPGLARRGGALLAADVAALAATHIGPAGHLTVIGHSYGATTVADAAAGSGMRADDVVLVGCPGTDLARTAADFHLPTGGHVYVGSAAADPVNLVAGQTVDLGPGGPGPLAGPVRLEVGLGADPAVDGFGSTRFKAETPQFTVNVVDEHLGYFGVGSESLYAIADVAAGHGDLLEAHGMTAPHRSAALGDLAARLGLPTWGLALTDPELGRAGTDGHQHEPIPPDP